ncbi:MAG: VOC family protein [Novosphingobium sp.]|nr:VOC family protein [Novosphingobium sp.]
MSTAQKAHFGFTKLLVEDLDKTAAFYKSVCGLEETARVDAKIGGRDISEILFAPTADSAATFVLLKFLDAPKPTNDEVILGFQTGDIDAFVERALAAGGAVVDPVWNNAEHGVKVAFVTDCEGHLIEVVQMI